MKNKFYKANFSLKCFCYPAAWILVATLCIQALHRKTELSEWIKQELRNSIHEKLESIQISHASETVRTQRITGYQQGFFK